MGVYIIILSLVYFVVFGLSSYCLGGALMRRLGLGGDAFISTRGRVGVEMVLGIGLWGLIYFPLSAIEGLWTDFGRTVFIVFMILAIVRWHKHIEGLTEAYNNWRTARRESGRKVSLHSVLGIMLGLLFLLSFLNACGPSHAWDELVDHLPRAKHIAECGVLADDPTNPFAGYPAICELIFAPLTGLASELCAVTVFTFGIALLLMLTGYARTFLPPGWANPVAVIFFSMPLVTDLMRSALVDLPLACFCFAAFYLISSALSNNGNNNSPRSRLVFAAGIFMGFAMSVKYTGLLVAVSWLVVLPIILLLKRIGLRRTILLLLVFLLPALVVCGGWYIRNLLLYGNPVHPFLDELFKGEQSAAFGLYAFARPEMQKSPLEILLYPIRLTFDYDLIRHWYRAITPAFLCFIPLGLLIRGKEKYRSLFNLAIWLGLVHLCLAYFTSPGHTRYLLPLWAVWSPAAAWGMARASDGSRFLRNVLIPLVLIIPLGFVLTMQGKRFVELAPYFAGKIDRDEVIAEDMPSHTLVKRMNKYVTSRGKVLSIEPRVYYMPEGTVIGTPGIEAPDSPRWDEGNTAVIAAEMKAKGYTHLFIDFSSRQIKHAMAMDFFLVAIPSAAEGRYFSYEGIVENMEERYGIAKFFTREDLYMLSTMGGFDVYRDASGRDWHWVERAAIEERAQHTRNLQFIRHFYLLEDYILEKVEFGAGKKFIEKRRLIDAEKEPTGDETEIDTSHGAVLYKMDYSNLRRLRHGQKRYKGGRLKGLNRTPKLTPEIQNPNEDELYLWIKQKDEGMI